MRSRRCVGTLAALLTLLVPRLGAQQITGRVVDGRTGEPLGAVQVFIAGSGIGALSQQNGRYLLLNVPTGTHSLSAERIGYQAVTVQVTVSAGQTVVQDFRLDEQAPTTLTSLAQRAQVAPAALTPYLQELRQDGLVVVDGAANDVEAAQVAPTPAGQQILDRLIAARREALARLLSDWAPERHAEVAEMLSRLARALATDETTPRPVPT